MVSDYGVITKDVFSSLNTYIAPYSSAKDGGELVSEFNLRAALNAAAAKEVQIKLDGMNLTIHSGFTGCGNTNSVGASLDSNGSLAIASGQCVIKGYFVHLMETITMRTSDLISAGELTDKGYPKKLILLRVNTTSSSQTNPHDERLRPPRGSTYPCVDIVITPPVVGNGLRNYEVFENEMLLGVLSRTDGYFKVTPNPFKDGVFSSGQILWDKETTPWVQPPEGGEAGTTIFGLTKATTENSDGLIEITDRLWLRYNSDLGSYLRALVVNPEDATIDNGSPLGLFVGYHGSDPRFPENDSFNATRKMFTTKQKKDSFDVAFRVLQDGVKSANPYAFTKLSIPLATYSGRRVPDFPTTVGTAGLIDPVTLKQFDDLYRAADSYTKGKEYGPFLDKQEWETFRHSVHFQEYDGSEYHSKGNMFYPGDYFWILNDEIEVDGGKLATSFGSVRGNAETTVFGKADTSTATLTLSFEKDYPIPLTIKTNDVKLSGSSGSFTMDVGAQQIELSFADATFAPNSQIIFNATAPPLTLDLAATSSNIEIEIVDPQETLTGSGSGTFQTSTVSQAVDIVVNSATGTLAGQITAKTGSTQTIQVDAATIKDVPVTITAGASIDGKIELNKQSTTVEGKLSQLNLQAAGNVTFTGEMTSFTQNVSVRYVYSRDWYVDSKGNYVEADTYSFKPQAVLRGFATPATYQYYGFVRPGSGEKIGDVIMDETNHLALSPATIDRLQTVGWVYDTRSGELELHPDTVTSIMNHWFVNPVTLVLKDSGWGSDIIISKVRGDITLDISNSNLVVTEDDSRPVVVTCDDVSTINIKALKSDGVTLSENMINVRGCVLTKSNFNSIYEWVDSRFDSGSNILSLDNPWVTITNPFSDDLEFDHRVQSRFVSVTRGRYGIEDAVLDVWVKVEDSSSIVTDWKDPVILQSKASYFLPPLSVVYEDSALTLSHETQYIPNNLNAVVTGTGGVHKAWVDGTPELVGSFVSTIEWADNGPISVVGRLTNPDVAGLHGLYDLRFRAHVQFTNIDSAIETSIDYTSTTGMNPRSS